jgi:hypothetical protein
LPSKLVLDNLGLAAAATTAAKRTAIYDHHHPHHPTLDITRELTDLLPRSHLKAADKTTTTTTTKTTYLGSIEHFDNLPLPVVILSDVGLPVGLV